MSKNAIGRVMRFNISIKQTTNHALILGMIFSSFRLEKSMLFLLNANVTLTPSSLKANSAGEGKKSAITLTLPKGSLVYLIFVLII